jgi:ribosomal protein L3 glutamine methyltransferase
MKGVQDLISIRDFLRYAVSSFREAGLAHGHGASSALDEAAFIILEALHLPVDDINPWLDARLTGNERRTISGLIAARIETRKPAAYLLGKTYLQGHAFRVDERVIVPRSYIAELLFSGQFASSGESLIDADAITTVLDLCTGSGCLAILAAIRFPNALIDATDISADALKVAKMNVTDYELEDRIKLHRGDLFKPLAAKRYDLIIANPPYVAGAEVEAFPPEYAHEPRLAHLGGNDGLDIVRRILAEAPDHLTDAGSLICEIGTGHGILAHERPDLDFMWLDTDESQSEVFWLSRKNFSA